MKIGIDARLYGPEHTGLGRYITNLVDSILKLDKKNSYVLFVTSKHLGDFKTSSKLKLVVTDVPIYSISEQIILPFVYSKEKLDLLHVPHFNAPILYFGKLIITLHDLIKHVSSGPATTTRPPLVNWLIRLAYRFETLVITKKSKKIIVPSNFVKEDVIKILKIDGQKIVVTYEATSSSLTKRLLSKTEKQKTLEKYGLTQPFLIYTGNVYPHKNIDLLISSVVKHNDGKEVDLSLGIVCARSVFWERTNKMIEKLGATGRVKMLGFVDDKELSKLYSLALGLVHPSKMEGFGLTGLEAMGVGLPVISSNTTSLPEVYGDACLYFDPNSSEELQKAIETLIGDSELRIKLSRLGEVQAKKYSWTITAEKTIEIYNSFRTK
jgi:glycosyltransferase involved in cell wall biosynthesis